ncbi:alpha/beta hydrolase [Paenibacillus odorifer]|uniref:alpha/beta hydrolase n=1 Tax=Paenibacillus odorifer TaxID=189426 RepID=UPI00096D52C8|nr:alpha/beta hydrolase [Paenibacillus odorifer]OMD95590.1 hypothetical protein BSK67_09060 [Paenibacillus odorifer]
MDDFLQSFIKIIPSIRASERMVLLSQHIHGERLEIPCGESHSVEVWLHRAQRQNSPVLFELHGGGLVLGDAAKDDNLCEEVRTLIGCHVVGINYRKAPENPYPAALDDVCGVMKWFAENAESFSMDPSRFAVMGFSGGATLATAASMKAREQDRYSICCQILHYPYLDAVTDPAAKERCLSDMAPELMKAFTFLYSSEEQRKEPYVSPLHAPERFITNMPPVIIVLAECDALCYEGEQYAIRLSRAGIPVFIRQMQAAHHGYIEDAFNSACYNELPIDTKETHAINFRELANEAVEWSAQWLRMYLN